MTHSMKNKNPCSQTERFSSSNTTVTGTSRFSSSNEFGDSSNIIYGGERGYPTKCVCGSGLAIHTSQSKNNPGRPYFRCAQTRENGHLFKWVEDGTYEEVKDILVRFERRESELDHGRIELNELKLEVRNLKEEVFKCKTEIRKSGIKNVVVVICLVVLVLCVVYHLIPKKGDLTKVEMV